MRRGVDRRVAEDERVTEPFEKGRPAEVDPSSVTTRDDVVGIVHAMANDLRKNPDAWENVLLESYLDGLAAAMEDIEQTYASRGETAPEQPSWKLVAQLLVSASGYE
jgi:hypothetical protein